jgi:HNH endonuclease/AP2 domain
VIDKNPFITISLKVQGRARKKLETCQPEQFADPVLETPADPDLSGDRSIEILNVSDPASIKAILDRIARENAQAVKSYSKIIAIDAAKRSRRRERAVAKTLKAAPVVRANRSRAVHSHTAHGGARVASGDSDGGGSGSTDGPSTDGDGAPSPRSRRSSKARDPDITAVEVYALLDHDPATGLFRWRLRTSDMFEDGPRHSAETKCTIWNRRLAGKIAGSKDCNGYIVIGLPPGYVLAHRLAWFVTFEEWPRGEITHFNGVRRDNRIRNLRQGTFVQILYNQTLRRDNRSGFKGVSYDPALGKYRARATLAGRRFYLGSFPRAVDAARVYDEFAARHFGEFARLNFSLPLTADARP